MHVACGVVPNRCVPAVLSTKNGVNCKRVSPRARLGGDSRGGAVLDRPDFLTGDRDAGVPSTESGKSVYQGDKSRGTGGGHYRVLLVDHPNHTEKGVVDAILTVVPGTDQSHAANCFHTSRSLGIALVTTALLEIAEHYQHELYRRGLRTRVDPDTTTL